jgi:hypothetical protein
VGQGRTSTQEFYIQGFGKSGLVSYTASAPGLSESVGTVTIARSGIVIKGPSGFGGQILTTIHGNPLKLTVYSALLGPSGDYVSPQFVAGGRSVAVNVTSSDPGVGAVTAVAIAGGSAFASTQFQPIAPGKVTLAVNVPSGFSPPEQYSSVMATVITPGIGLPDSVNLGHDLQVRCSVTLGEAAPADGLQLTLSSNNPGQLLLSPTATATGSDFITLDIPPKGSSASFFLQSLGDDGEVSYVASAPGYQSRTGKVILTPSGVVIGVGPPDEAELFRKEAADEVHGFQVNLSNRKSVSLGVYMLQLHPISHRGADITVQALRPGVSVTVQLESSNPAVGSIFSPVTITGGSSATSAEFVPRSEGETVISVVTPPGLTPSNNATSQKAIVKE